MSPPPQPPQLPELREDERFGPLTLVRLVKEDGRALILFTRARSAQG